MKFSITARFSLTVMCAAGLFCALSRGLAPEKRSCYWPYWRGPAANGDGRWRCPPALE